MSDGPRDSRAGSSPTAPSVLTAAAGAIGAVGVALAAIAAHKVESPALATAANLMMVHAAAAVAIASAAGQACAAGGSVHAFVRVGALMLVAVSLFGTDVTLHTLSGQHLFPFAAPIGGSLTIASWLVLALIAGRRAWRGN